MRTGSLFSGVGMLDVAVTELLGGTVAWHVESDPAASRVLAHHWPDVPNHGDITEVDWSEVEPVDVLTGGFPCTDISSAGRRQGLRPNTRSGLWFQMACAIGQLWPELVVIENVRALTSTPAGRTVEPCPWCVGDRPDRAMRALGAVLGDLADLGYDARWCGLRAADIGAPHGRLRIFIVARPANAAGPRRGAVQGAAGRLDSTPTAGGRAPELGRHGGAAADADSAGRIGPWPSRTDLREPDRPPAGRDRAELLPTPRATDGTKGGPGQRGSSGDLMLPSAVALLPTPMAQRSGRQQSPSPNAAVRPSLDTLATLLSTPTATDAAASRNATANRSPNARPFNVGTTLTDAVDGPADWSTYEPAIRRWEAILGRPAPAPTITGQRGSRKLNPALCEWLMGWPAGWVTAVPDVSVNDQLRLCGNGVVPQQAVAALEWLLAADLDSRRSA